jgi:hypothetical protein
MGTLKKCFEWSKRLVTNLPDGVTVFYRDPMNIAPILQDKHGNLSPNPKRIRQCKRLRKRAWRKGHIWPPKDLFEKEKNDA